MTSLMVKNVEVCITIKEKNIYPGFTVYDFGYAYAPFSHFFFFLTFSDIFDQREGNLVRPMGFSRINYKVSSQQICAMFNDSEHVLQNMTIFPLKRISDVSSVGTGLSSTEKGLFFAIAACYTVSMIFNILTYLRDPWFKTNSLGMVRELLLIAASTGITEIHHIHLFHHSYLSSTVRAVYFFLLGSEVFGTSENTIEYILVEIPTFLYISLAVQMMMIFVIARKMEKARFKDFTMKFLVANAIIYILFIIIIVLFATLNDGEASKTETASSSCGGRVFTYTSNGDNHIQIIRIIYRVLVTLFSTVVSIFLIVTGVRLHIFVQSTLHKGITTRVQQVPFLFFRTIYHHPIISPHEVERG